MRLRPANDTFLFGVVVLRRARRSETLAGLRIGIGVHEFVTEPECGRLSTAIRRQERAVRIPCDGTRHGIEVIVVARVLPNDECVRPVLEFVERTRHDRVTAKIRFGLPERRIERSFHGERAMVHVRVASL